MKDVIGILGTCFLMAGFAPYLLALWRKEARPHAFTWLLWGLINAIVCAVQFTGNGGAGVWTAGVAAAFNFGIGFYAVRHGEKNITRADWGILLTVLAAIPLWALTKNPVASVVLVSVIDTLALVPTLRKSWHRPHEEVATTFAFGMVGFACSIYALDAYTFANICYPAKVLMTNALLISLLLYRRHAVARMCPA